MKKLTVEMERSLEHVCPQLVDLLKNVEGRIEVEKLLDVYESYRAAMYAAESERRQRIEDTLASVPAE
jgi:hypothetical protein